MRENKKNYDVTKFKRPSVTVDIIIFNIKDEGLKFLLIKRNLWPFRGTWAIPGGFVKMEESLDEAAIRELREETGIKDVYLEQLYTFGDPKRDPRTRVITVIYFALINSNKLNLKVSTDASAVKWFSLDNMPKLAFDHKKILKYSLQRLRWKLEYTTVAFSLLPKEFTLTNLQNIYETVFSKDFDKRNFRKKILSLNILKYTGKLTLDVAHRPAKIYSFKGKIGQIINML